MYVEMLMTLALETEIFANSYLESLNIKKKSVDNLRHIQWISSFNFIFHFIYRGELTESSLFEESEMRIPQQSRRPPRC